MGIFSSVKSSPVSTARSSLWHWHEPGTSKEEKWLIRKLDIFILTYSCLCFFIKYLDQTNISNAYVSGMKEELGLYGNELNLMQTTYNIGYILGAPISNLLLTITPPRIHLPTCLLTWSIFVLALFRVTHASQIYVLRFFIGLFESAALPGLHYVLGSWYRTSELGRRSAFFVISGVLGQMFSGYLQSGLYAGMDGRGGLSAWRWLFVFDAVLAVPVVVYGVTCFPDTPATTRAWWLSAWERDRARERVEEEGRGGRERLDWSVVGRVVGSWQLYVFCVAWSLWSLTCASSVQTWMALWLKSEKHPDGSARYSVPQINNIPTVVGAVNFFFMVGSGLAADALGTRAPVCLLIGLLLTFSYTVYVVWPASTTLKMAAFFVQGCYGCISPLLSGWVNSLCGGDDQLRAFTMAMMMSVGQACSTPFSQYLFPASDAPAYRRTHGYAAALVFVVAMTVWCAGVLGAVERWYWRKQAREAAAAERVEDEGSVEGQKSAVRETVSEA